MADVNAGFYETPRRARVPRLVAILHPAAPASLVCQLVRPARR